MNDLEKMLEQAQAHGRDVVNKAEALDLNEKVGYLADNEVEVKGLNIYRQQRNWGVIVELSQSGDKVYEGNGKGIERCIFGYWVNLVLDAYQKHEDIKSLKNQIEQAQAAVDKIEELHTNYQDTDDNHYTPPEPRNLLQEIVTQAEDVAEYWFRHVPYQNESALGDRMRALIDTLKLYNPSNLIEEEIPIYSSEDEHPF